MTALVTRPNALPRLALACPACGEVFADNTAVRVGSGGPVGAVTVRTLAKTGYFWTFLEVTQWQEDF